MRKILLALSDDLYNKAKVNSEKKEISLTEYCRRAVEIYNETPEITYRTENAAANFFKLAAELDKEPDNLADMCNVKLSLTDNENNVLADVLLVNRTPQEKENGRKESKKGS